MSYSLLIAILCLVAEIYIYINYRFAMVYSTWFYAVGTVRRCQETLQSHNETVKDMMRAELETEYEMKVQRLDSRYQSDLSNAK